MVYGYLAKSTQVYLVRKRNTERAVCLELLSRCTASAAMRTQPFLSFIHTRQPAVDLVQTPVLPDMLQKPGLGLAPAPASAPAPLPGLLPAFANSSLLPPPPLLRPLPFTSGFNINICLPGKCRRRRRCGAPWPGFCLTSQLLEPQFPASRDYVSVSHPFVSNAAASERGSGGGANVIHSTFLPSSTKQPRNTVGLPSLCLNRAEPQAPSVPAFPSCHSWLSSLPLPPQRPLSPPAGGPGPSVCIHSFLPQSKPFFLHSCPAVLMNLQIHIIFWGNISGKIL